MGSLGPGVRPRFNAGRGWHVWVQLPLCEAVTRGPGGGLRLASAVCLSPGRDPHHHAGHAEFLR